jgi:hypothetical protein
MNKFKTEIAIRVYSERPGRKPVALKGQRRDPGPSDWTLVFDCETTIDAKQSLRFGFYQVRRGDEREDEGVFVDDTSLPTEERLQLNDYATAHGLKTLSVEAFRREVFLKYGYREHATIVGFNLPFDLSRIAIAHGPARGHMRGGFVFELSPNRRDPCVRVKHLDPQAALIDFTKPWEQGSPRGMRKRKFEVEARRGYFVDVRTFAATQLSQRFSLKSLAETLRTPTQKHDTEEHGQMSRQYLDYARADVQVTWECYRTLAGRYAEHGLSKRPDRLLSEASIGKAYLQKMGIKPLLETNPEIPREQFGEIFCAYYGGRAEVRMRRVIQEVVYCDFKSMYPTVNSLMGLWEFVIADGFTAHDTTIDTQVFLDSVTIEHLQQPGTWRRLRTLVSLKPDQEILPARAKYNKETNTIGLNHLTTDQPLWYTLADCVVSKLLTGKSPRIEEAKTFRPGAHQIGLKPVKILGREDYRIDPATDDFFVG